jgi:hypothetical protein
VLGGMSGGGHGSLGVQIPTSAMRLVLVEQAADTLDVYFLSNYMYATPTALPRMYILLFSDLTVLFMEFISSSYMSHVLL